MFITKAYAQAAGATDGGPAAMIGMVLPMALVAAVFYFLVIRPQQRKMKDHQQVVSKVARGDTIATSGGLIGRVSKVVDDNEVLVEVGENIKVRVLRQAITEVRSKGQPLVQDNDKSDSKPAKTDKKTANSEKH